MWSLLGDESLQVWLRGSCRLNTWEYVTNSRGGTIPILTPPLATRSLEPWMPCPSSILLSPSSWCWLAVRCQCLMVACRIFAVGLTRIVIYLLSHLFWLPEFRSKLMGRIDCQLWIVIVGIFAVDLIRIWWCQLSCGDIHIKVLHFILAAECSRQYSFSTTVLAKGIVYMLMFFSTAVVARDV